MKLIEAMKKAKELQRKAKDLRKKVEEHCADLNVETPVYGTPEKQREKIKEWLQAHADLMKEILKLRILIQRTNLATKVDIEVSGQYVTKTIAEWIHRRRELAKLDETMWRGLTDRGLREGEFRSVESGPPTKVEIRRYYDPEQRDEMIERYQSEPGEIDRRLEVVNAVTDLIEE